MRDRAERLQRKLWSEQHRTSGLLELNKNLQRDNRILREQLKQIAIEKEQIAAEKDLLLAKQEEQEETEEISVTTMSGEEFIARVPLRKPVYSGEPLSEPVERPAWVESVVEKPKRPSAGARYARMAAYVVVVLMPVLLVLGHDNPLFFSGMCMVLVFLTGVLSRTPAGVSKKSCKHADAVDVNSEVTGELLARWCPACETQLVKKEVQ